MTYGGDEEEDGDCLLSTCHFEVSRPNELLGGYLEVKAMAGRLVIGHWSYGVVQRDFESPSCQSSLDNFAPPRVAGRLLSIRCS
jgi:hypothetical protein